MDLQTTADAIRALVDNIERVITGKRRAAELGAVALFSGQHLLIEDVPGVGKTMLARAVARSIDGSFRRIQGTADLMPADITGTNVFDPAHGTFSFSPGPVFAHVVLVDEINRATPKSQSALLEVMEERSVSVEGYLHEVPNPFFVVATRNPIEHHGTFPLPEGELDRFGLSLAVGYPDHDAERRVVVAQRTGHPIDQLEPILDPESVGAHQEAVRTVHIDDGVLDYALRIVRATRDHPEVALGASPRGTLSLTRAAQALALLAGRDYVLPDDVKTVAPAALVHRILPNADRAATRPVMEQLVASILRGIPAPVDVEHVDGRHP